MRLPVAQVVPDAHHVLCLLGGQPELAVNALVSRAVRVLRRVMNS
jgi:hypothetical protein